MSKLKIVDSSGNPISSHAEDFNAIWSSRIEVANKRNKIWSDKFKTDQCERFYYGEQWQETGSSYEPYVTNEIFVALDVKMPSLLFSKPVYSIRPKPGKSDTDIDAAAQRSRVRADVLNYFAAEEKTGLGTAAELSILDAAFRFGIVEVGYSADWVDNPRAGQPVLESDREFTHGDEPEIVKEPAKLPKHERIFVKNIPAENFRVGGLEKPESLEDCSWCGYWEYYRYDDIVATYKLKNVTYYDRSEEYTTLNSEEEVLSDEIKEIVNSSKLVKLWKIWDNREKVKITFMEGFEQVIRQQDFKRLPLFDLRFRKRLKSWYPIPMVYNWLSPQIEMNETRETARAHRRRFVRKFIAGSGAFSEDGIADLQNGDDGTIVESLEKLSGDTIMAMPDAGLGDQHMEMLQVSRADFDNITGVTPEQRGLAQTTTATQANIVDARAEIRESRDQEIVAQFLCRIGKEILLQAKEKLTSEILVPISLDSSNLETPIGGEIEPINEAWESIKLSSLGDEDMDVNIMVASLSPISNQKQKEAYIEFLSIMTNFPQLMLSSALVRETAIQTGYNNEKVIRTFQEMALLSLSAQMNQLEFNAATSEAAVQQLETQDNSNPIAQAEVAQNNPNTQDQINQQLNNQVVQ